METTQNIPAVVGEAIAGRAATVRAELARMANSVQGQTLDLAELLVEARENNYPAQWGFASTAEYAEKELGLKKRKSEYLQRIVTVCQEVQMLRREYEGVGITKLRAITRLNPKEKFFNPDTKEHEELGAHIVRLVQAAPNLTLTEIDDEVARLTGQTGEDKQVLRNFKITQSCWDNVFVPALEKVRRMLGSAGRDAEGTGIEYSLGACLEAILADFNAGAEENLDVANDFTGNDGPPVVAEETTQDLTGAEQEQAG